MFADIIKFEVLYRFRKPAVYIFAALFFTMTFSAIATDTVQMGGAIGNAARNSPFEIVRLLGMMSVMGLLALTGFVATAVNRDYEYRTSEFFFATPVRKPAYLLGRFTGSLLTAMAAVSVAALGIVLASVMPWQDPERIQAFNFVPYAYSLGVFVLPNLFLAGAILFAFAALTRKVLYTYVSMIGFLTFWAISRTLTRDLESVFAASLFDPFGVEAFNAATRYWTVVERNTMLPPIMGPMLLNRLIWVGVGAAVLGFAIWRFRLSVAEKKGRAGAAVAEASAEEMTPARAAPAFPAGMVVSPTLSFTPRSRLIQLWHQTRTESLGLVRSVPFLVILVFGVFNLVGGLFADFDQLESYPLTRIMVDTIEGTFSIFLFIFMLVYAGVLVWRERGAGQHEIQSALPVPDWLPLASKLSALLLVNFLALVLAMVVTIIFQMSKGYFDFELGIYIRGLFLIQLPGWFAVAALAIACQVFTNNKVAGFSVMIVYFILLEVVASMSIEHNLYLFGETPSYRYSDMNGLGHYAKPVSWFLLYWGLASAVLLYLSVLFWVRGTDVRGRFRWKEARRRLTRPRVAALAVSLAAFVVVGGWIFYNTNVLNEFVDAKRSSELSALYEQRYKQYEEVPQPRVTDVRLAVDIFPEERRVEIEGDLVLRNKTDGPIGELHVANARMLELTSLSLPDEAITLDDREIGYRIYELDEPLGPGEEFDLHYTARITNPGFVNSRSNVRVVENGTFLDNTHIVPSFGYWSEQELANAHERKKHDLPPKDESMPAPDEPGAGDRIFIHDADWVNYEATLSTSPDQVAITAGYLENEWEEGGRRYFHYTMDVPILHFYPFISGRYEVATGSWNDVEIAVYHHPKHDMNVDRMIESIQHTLEYMSAEFGPYQHRQLRIVEFPRYQTFAQSFATTIPYSESIHFVEDLRREGVIDMVYYVTAHEVAHQWWGHQVAGAFARGGTFIDESFAQYSALMVMEKDQGGEAMEKFLSYELDRYLQGRGRERKEELPLVLVENTGYTHYRKGSLATYALRDYIGEEAMNAALRQYVEEHRFVGPPYPLSTDLVAALRAATPPEYEYLIEDMFETITLYDNRAEAATLEENGDGTYTVTLELQSRKMRADGRGVETEIPHEDWIEVGVYGREDGDGEEPLLYLEKHRLESGTNEIEIVVDEEPSRAGIDPRHLLVDRVPDDNVKRVTG
jgi:ABC-type transport system involved in multi-copper enzyme maturation permease subunit